MSAFTAQSFSDWVPEGFDPLVLARDLAIAIVLGQVLCWHYVRFAQVLSNKRKFGRIFVFIAATTLLLITTVKSSLALSLGLVGALSIIRFRTPIKEPEELAYLFLAIAVGVGLGASQVLATLIVFTVVLLYLAVRRGGGRDAPVRTVLQVSAPIEAGEEAAASALQALLPAAERYCSRVDLRRVDATAGELHATLLVELAGASDAASLLTALRSAVPQTTVSLIERDALE